MKKRRLSGVEWLLLLGGITWMCQMLIPSIILFHKTGEKLCLFLGGIMGGWPFLPGIVVMIYRRARR
jgi:hypothetical protein